MFLSRTYAVHIKRKVTMSLKTSYVLLHQTTFIVTLEHVAPEVTYSKSYNCSILKERMTFCFGKPQLSLFAKKSPSVVMSLSVDNDKVTDVGKVSKSTFSNASILKSTLQKAIRRGDTLVALRCSKTFLQVDRKAFFRRLIIIAAEDVYLDAAGLSIIWMFIVVSLDDDFNISKPMECWILGYVKALCKEKQTYDYLVNTSSEQICTISKSLYQKLIRIVLIQTTFSEWDTQLLVNYHNNFHNKLTLEKVEPIDCKKIEVYTKSDFGNFPTYGIDHHTHPDLPKFVVTALQVNEKANDTTLKKFTQPQIKALIWKLRSSINFRKEPLANETDVINYETVKAPLETICFNLLKQKFQQ